MLKQKYRGSRIVKSIKMKYNEACVSSSQTKFKTLTCMTSQHQHHT